MFKFKHRLSNSNTYNIIINTHYGNIIGLSLCVHVPYMSHVGFYLLNKQSHSCPQCSSDKQYNNIFSLNEEWIYWEINSKNNVYFK